MAFNASIRFVSLFRQRFLTLFFSLGMRKVFASLKCVATLRAYLIRTAGCSILVKTNGLSKRAIFTIDIADITEFLRRVTPDAAAEPADEPADEPAAEPDTEPAAEPTFD